MRDTCKMRWWQGVSIGIPWVDYVYGMTMGVPSCALVHGVGEAPLHGETTRVRRHLHDRVVGMRMAMHTHDTRVRVELGQRCVGRPMDGR